MSDGTIHSPQAVTPPEPGHGYDARSSSGLVATVEQTVDIIGPSGSPGVPPFSSPPATDSGHGRGSGSATEQPRATTSNSRFNSGAMLAPTTSDPASASDSSTTPTASARPTDVWHDAVAPSPSRTPGPDSTIRTDKGKGRAAPLAVVTDQLGVSSGGGAKPAFESPFMSEPLTADSPTSYLATDADGEASDADADSDARHSTLLAGHRGGSTITPHGGHGSNSRARTPTQRRPLAMSHTFASPTFSAASPVSPFSPQLRRRLSDQTHSPTGATRPHIRHSRSYLSHVAGRDSADDDPEAFPAMGSIRMGTSALVSALTALPWDNDAGFDDEPSSVGEESGSDTGSHRLSKTSVFPARPKPHRMHSSLHTIRPMEPPKGSPSSEHSAGRRHLFHRKQHLDFPFRENTIARRAQAPGVGEINYQLSPNVDPSLLVDLPTEDRVESELESDASAAAVELSSAEIKRRRRNARLAARLKEVFGLEEEEEVLEEMTCWLLRSVMLKGYMFLTRKRICFFAHMPDNENTVIKSGPLWKKASRTKLSTKFWFTLRNDVLSWYESSNDPYFPKGNISLQYASSCDSVGGARFKLRTTERNYTFTADNEANAEEWIRVINKVIFKRQQEGETVRLIIPLEAVIDVELGPSLEFAETIEVKVVDSDDSMSIDSYFFASFPDNEHTYNVLQNLLDSRPSVQLPKLSSETTLQTYTNDGASDATMPEATASASVSATSGTNIIPKIGAVLRPLGLSRESKSDNRVPIAPPPRPSLPEHYHRSSSELEHGSEVESTDQEGGYPPRQSGAPPPGMEHRQSWRDSWIRNPASKLFGPQAPLERKEGKEGKDKGDGAKRRRPSVRKPVSVSVTEVIEPAPPLSSDEDDFSGTESATTLSPSSKTHASGSDDNDPMEQQFHTFFALPNKEKLITHFSGSLYRLLPVHGRFFISTHYFCFRSSALLSKTRMIVPIRELYGMKAQKSFRFGHSGLIVIIKGYEELFLEFSSSKRRNECMRLLEDRMEAMLQSATPLTNLVSGRDARIVEDLNDELLASTSSMSPLVASASATPLFNSATSSLVDFKPEPMKIVCLTIGSRGDVQPYIALCKGLQAEGHTTVIVSHGEYRDWVEGHGIDFQGIGGDPAELMQLCVDNGMFTVSFLKEGLQKFRVWLDDLLMSSWEACQGAQLLIESPSAMAGLHIAEALRIPYYRAFTMPWTRTRAYPQAFAVPEHKRGGSYNYMTYVMFDQIFWRAISGQINRWRKNTLHLEATTLDKMHQDKVPFLYNFSPTVVPPPLDWTEWIHITGYWFLDQADAHKQKAWAPPPGIVEFIDNAHARGKKVVYIGFGSIVVSDPQEMTRCVVEAVERSGVCAILTKGWSDRGQRKDSKDSKDSGKGDKEKDKDKDKDTQSLGDEEEMDPSEGADGIKFPDSIYAIDSIDHSWLFPRIDAACHHGGAGTTGASLRAGIPTIIKPFFGDQAFWAERVESLGVGSGIRKLTTDELSDALVQATTNERQIAKAKAVGEEIRRERGVQRAIQCIYRDLEYAKSLIRPLPTPTEERTNVPKKSGSLKRKVRKSISHVFTGPDRDASDESWSIVSDSGHLSQVSSPPGSRRTSNASTWNPIDAPGLASASASATASVSVPASAAASMTMSMPQPPPGSASASAPVSAPISNAASVSTHLSDDDEVYTPSPASGPTSGSTTSTSHRGPIAGLGSLVNHIVGRSRTPDERKN